MRTKEVKTYHSHQASAFFIGFFSLLFAGSFALLFFFPMFSVNIEGEIVDFSALDFFAFGAGKYIQQVYPDLSMENANKLLYYFDNYPGENFIFKNIIGFHWIIELIFTIMVAVGIVFGAIVALLGLAWIIRGRLFIPKSSLTFMRWSHGLYDGGIGLLYGFLYLFVTFIAVDFTVPPTLSMAIYPFVVLGIQVVVTIIVHIIYRFNYKNRVYEKKNKNDMAPISSTNNQKPQQNQPAMQPVYEKGLPANLNQVGDHSFAADDALTRAIIPEGITSLGNGAFANCHNLEVVSIPITVTRIGPNCFYNTPRLKQINYTGTKEDWRTVRRGTNWLVGSGTATINARDGAIVVNPNQ